MIIRCLDPWGNLGTPRNDETEADGLTRVRRCVMHW